MGLWQKKIGFVKEYKWNRVGVEFLGNCYLGYWSMNIFVIVLIGVS